MKKQYFLFGKRATDVYAEHEHRGYPEDYVILLGGNIMDMELFEFSDDTQIIELLGTAQGWDGFLEIPESAYNTLFNFRKGEHVTINVDFDVWAEYYKPIQSKREEWNGCLFETFGEDLAYVKNYPEQNKVWTIIDSDGELPVTDGYHYVNRFGYLITQKPAIQNVSYNIEDEIDIERRNENDEDQ